MEKGREQRPFFLLGKPATEKRKIAADLRRGTQIKTDHRFDSRATLKDRQPLYGSLGNTMAIGKVDSTHINALG
jgi:hypothetical protein